MPPLMRKDVGSPMGLFSTKLNVRKIRGVKTIESQIGDSENMCRGVAERMRISEIRGR